ncbi:unnamed protein product [Rotaria sordida]|uniref:BEN domain-containing protein n=1 Tax=Rotaria sordida TaxID=392033 RepID=A0A814PLM9_9BILA|nr:unnamed protein product [Rotaria sordida]
MGRKKSAMKDLNEEKENNNPCVEYTSSTADVTTNCPLTVGQKRAIELVDSNSIGNKEIEMINLKKRCIDIGQRVEFLENTFLSIQQHMTSVQNFFNDIIQSSNNDNDDVIMLNNNDFVTVNNDDVVTVNNDDDKTANVITILNIDDATLDSLKKEKSTSTARSILKYLYPNPELNFKLSNMDKALVDAIVDCVQKAHASELTTTAEIKHAMSNYFGLLNYKKKNKSTVSKKIVKKRSN